MSRMTVEMPQLGESVVEGTVGAWLKAIGDDVKRFEPLVEVITDKVNTEIPSPIAGKLLEVLVEEGETVAVGTPLAVLQVEGAGAADAETPAPATDAQPAPAEAESAAPAAAAAAGTGAAVGSGGDTTPEGWPRGVFSPLVRRLAKEHGVDLLQLTGSGAGGRVTKRDVLAHVETVAATPAAAPTLVAGTPETVAPAAPTPPRPAPAVATEPGDEVITPDAMRRAIAQHMVSSKQTVPHAWTMMEVDVTELVALREATKDEFFAREGVGLTYMPFFIKAVIESLKQFPHMNASWKDDRIVVKKRIHVGIAVGLDDGLVVPNIRDADRLNIAGIAQSMADLVTRARSGKLSLDDVQGGTITVNNTGAFGSVASYPIINEPQAAIITMETIRRVPVAVGDAIGLRSMMNICLSFDHRVTDGLYAGRFLQTVKSRLEAYGPETAVY